VYQREMKIMCSRCSVGDNHLLSHFWEVSDKYVINKMDH
jgi:hypothetical protein